MLWNISHALPVPFGHLIMCQVQLWYFPIVFLEKKSYHTDCSSYSVKIFLKICTTFHGISLTYICSVENKSRNTLNCSAARWDTNYWLILIITLNLYTVNCLLVSAHFLSFRVSKKGCNGCQHKSCKKERSNFLKVFSFYPIVFKISYRIENSKSIMKILKGIFHIFIIDKASYKPMGFLIVFTLYCTLIRDHLRVFPQLPNQMVG